MELFLAGRFFGFIIWLLLCIAVGKGAARWNRSFAKYLILSIIFSPVLIGIILLIMGENKSSGNTSPGRTKYIPGSGSDYVSPASGAGPGWICPKCGDRNPINSSFCKGCSEYKPVGSSGYTPSDFTNPTPAVKNEGDEWTCQECGDTNRSTSSSCKGCGKYR